ncbi:hypothetical protein HKX48_005886 [Thoreauomyces humboldtii]|nr:hypothetical protein HKX48_005886 [Thoreauomyces humboldtii]
MPSDASDSDEEDTFIPPPRKKRPRHVSSTTSGDKDLLPDAGGSDITPDPEDTGTPATMIEAAIPPLPPPPPPHEEVEDMVPGEESAADKLRALILAKLREWTLVRATPDLIQEFKAMDHDKRKPKPKGSAPKSKKGKPPKGPTLAQRKAEAIKVALAASSSDPTTTVQDDATAQASGAQDSEAATVATATAAIEDSSSQSKRKASETADERFPKRPRVQEDPDSDEAKCPLIFCMPPWDGVRYKCFFPPCDKDFKNVQGIKYHSSNYIHEIMDFLQWAYPSGEPPADRYAIQPDVQELYDQLSEKDWPFVIDDYQLMYPGAAKPCKIEVVLGYSKERSWNPRFVDKTVLETIRTTTEKQSTVEKRSTSTENPPTTVEQSTPKRVLKPRTKSNAIPNAKSAVKTTPVLEKRRSRKDPLTLALPTDLMAVLAPPNEITKVDESLIDTAILPLVQKNVPIDSFMIVPDREATEYFPESMGLNVQINAQNVTAETARIPLFESTLIRPTNSKRKRAICNVGGSVWGLDWCPIIDPEENLHYFAVGGYSRTITEHHVVGTKQTTDLAGCIQIWAAGNLDATSSSGTDITPQLEMCILHDYGCVFDMRWAPGEYFQSAKTRTQDDQLPRLGLLAATFGDGSMRVFEIPHPKMLRHRSGLGASSPTLFVKPVRPLFEVSIPETMTWKVAWGGLEQLATGCTNGHVAMWSLLDLITEDGRVLTDRFDSEPISYLPVHDSCVESLCFSTQVGKLHRTAPTTLITCGADGRLVSTDVRDPEMGAVHQRIRGIMTSCAFLASTEAFLFADADSGYRYLKPGEEESKNKKPSETDDWESGLVCVPQRSCGLGVHESCIWEIAAAPHMPFVATASADGCAKISNWKRIYAVKIHRPQQTNLYCVQYDAETETFHFEEDAKTEPVFATTTRGERALIKFFPPEVAIHRIAWNPCRAAGSWVLTGGAGGFVRLESALHM